MKIEGIGIDGFGHYHNAHWRDLNGALTVFHGPNEAGKSTLLAFISFVLFGPSAKRSVNKYEPLKGGKHGGQLLLRDADGAAYTVQRHRPKHSEPIVTDQNGAPVEPHAFKALMSDADEKLFRSVFAFTLDELASIDSLKDTGAQDRVFSASIAGAGRSPHLVIKELDDRTGVFMAPTRLTSDSVPGGIRHEIEELHRQLADARRRAAGYGAFRAAADEAGTRLEALSRSLAEFRAEHARYKRLVELHETWLEVAATTAELQGMGAEDAELAERVAVALEAAHALNGEAKNYRDALANGPRLDHQKRACEQALQSGLEDLGPGWDVKRLDSFDTSLSAEERIRAFEQSESRLRQAAADAEKDLELAERQHRQAARELENAKQQLDSAPGVDDEQLRRAEAAGRRLRAAWTEHATLIGGLEAFERGRPERPETEGSQPDRSKAGVIGAAVLALSAVGGSVWRWTQGDAVGAAVLLAGGVLLIVGLRSALRLWGAGGAQPLDDNEAAIQDARQKTDALSDEIEQLVSAIGVSREAVDAIGSSTVTALTIEEADEHLHHLRAAAGKRVGLVEQHQKLDRRVNEVADELAAVRNDTGAATEALARHAREWDSWRAEWGVGDSVTPPGTIRLVEAARRLRQTVEQGGELDAAIRHASAESAAWEQRARDLVARWSDGGPEVEDATGETLIAAVTRALARIREIDGDLARRRQLTEDLRTLNRQIDKQLGVDEAGRALRDELVTGAIDQWNARLADLDLKIEEADSRYEQSVREHQDLLRDLRDLETSADVPDLEDRVETKRAELTDATRRWAVVRLAHGVVNDTLRRFVRERQPAVLADASRMFEQVTEGAYTRVIQADDGSRLNLIDARDRTKTDEALSRGTREQLYTCLRLALTNEYARQRVDLPMALDDVMVNFDTDRSRAMARLLVDFSRSHQLLLFTCHPSTVQLLCEIDPRTQVLDLERFGGSDHPV
ncbi:MAG: ATP-binding protein [Planctomycetota bacterium]